MHLGILFNFVHDDYARKILPARKIKEKHFYIFGQPVQSDPVQSDPVQSDPNVVFFIRPLVSLECNTVQKQNSFPSATQRVNLVSYKE
jgi:hypothetical protein